MTAVSPVNKSGNGETSVSSVALSVGSLIRGTSVSSVARFSSFTRKTATSRIAAIAKTAVVKRCCPSKQSNAFVFVLFSFFSPDANRAPHLVWPSPPSPLPPRGIELGTSLVATLRNKHRPTLCPPRTFAADPPLPKTASRQNAVANSGGQQYSLWNTGTTICAFSFRHSLNSSPYVIVLTSNWESLVLKPGHSLRNAVGGGAPIDSRRDVKSSMSVGSFFAASCITPRRSSLPSTREPVSVLPGLGNEVHGAMVRRCEFVRASRRAG
mmetsp:Transcript_843/g.3259  ORF Transcript_843/g.3259 Transcript_843/m.3259 type:complete len:268 (-) Transcript_843:168-971(-)